MLEFSPVLSGLVSGYELYGKKDSGFIEALFKCLRDSFHYKPKISQKQFFTQGFAEAKCLFIIDLIRLVKQKLGEINRRNGKTASGERFSNLPKNEEFNTVKSRLPHKNIQPASPVKVDECFDKHFEDSILHYNPESISQGLHRSVNAPLRLFKTERTYAVNSECSSRNSALSDAVMQQYKSLQNQEYNTSPWGRSRTPSPLGRFSSPVQSANAKSYSSPSKSVKFDTASQRSNYSTSSKNDIGCQSISSLLSTQNKDVMSEKSFAQIIQSNLEQNQKTTRSPGQTTNGLANIQDTRISNLEFQLKESLQEQMELRKVSDD
jgi:hypothetical protein